MERFGDPGFRYHATMSRLWGLLALRFADADLLPFDYSIYATELGAYLRSLEKVSPADFFRGEVEPLIKKCRDWKVAAEKMTARLEAWRSGDSESVPEDAINANLMAEERALLAEEGIPGRPWFRHLVYAPLPSYEAETLPGLREALEANDLERARKQATLLGGAIDRAREILQHVAASQ
jgi:N-acetylated-alpha-linked acidic dipeptidase